MSGPCWPSKKVRAVCSVPGHVVLAQVGHLHVTQDAIHRHPRGAIARQVAFDKPSRTEGLLKRSPDQDGDRRQDGLAIITSISEKPAAPLAARGSRRRDGSGIFFEVTGMAAAPALLDPPTGQTPARGAYRYKR